MSNLLTRLNAHLNEIKTKPTILHIGELTRLIGMTLEASGVKAPVGAKCRVLSDVGAEIEAEVVGFGEGKSFLMCTENVQGLSPGARIIPTMDKVRVPVGPQLLGRILDGAGRPLDGGASIKSDLFYPMMSQPLNPLGRAPVSRPLDVGVRAINSLLTVGRGQRMGLFAGSGVGKSVLLGMMTRFTTADVIVVGLIGERGREVKEFIEKCLGSEGLKRSVVIAAPADASALMRLHGAMWATTIAEYFRDQGAQVLLLMDSLTRFAQAQREIALAIGEPPATKGYPPSVFAKLPQLVERAGNIGEGGGSITAFYTVLTEGDDQQDPIADAARAILDGHVVLSRHLAEAGHYPAIDIEASISRVMPHVVDTHALNLAQEFKKLYSIYQQNKDLIQLGAYKKGTNPAIDLSISMLPFLENYLQQGMNESVDFQKSVQGLQELFVKAQELAAYESRTAIK